MNLKEYSQITNAVDSFKDRVDEIDLDRIKKTIADMYDKFAEMLKGSEVKQYQQSTLKMNFEVYANQIKVGWDVYFGKRKMSAEDMANIPPIKKMVLEVCNNLDWEEEDED